MTAPAELAWCMGHFELIGGGVAWVGRRGCACGPEREHELAERQAVIDGFVARARALDANAARWALISLITALGRGVEREEIEHALALVEPGGVWEGGLD